MKKDTKGIGKLHDLNLRIMSMPFSEALVEVMDAYNIKVEQLEKRSLLNKKRFQDIDVDTRNIPKFL